MLRLGLLATLLASSAALANPLTVCAGLGVTEDQVNSSSSQPENNTLSVFGRYNVTGATALELDLTKIDSGYGATARAATALVVFDLRSGARLVPQLFVGAGLDRIDDYGTPIDGNHVEAGLGLEYRADGGFTLGARFHLGSRSFDTMAVAVPQTCCLDCCLGSAPTSQSTEFRSLDAYAGVRF
jgi:hypothetical protein